MQRTQISLEENQHQLLTQEARKRGTSMSAIIRGLIDVNLKNTSNDRSKLSSLIGIAEGDGKPVGRHHKQYLYGEK